MYVYSPKKAENNKQIDIQNRWTDCVYRQNDKLIKYNKYNEIRIVISDKSQGSIAVADPGFLQGGCGSWCLWSAPSPFMPSLPPTVKKISWELAAR